MKEGLMKNTSITAMAVAAGMILSMGSAFAADLGGNCCADLEERVAELEATAARKGTRKTSLEIWGLVNASITGWDDGARSNATLGYGNHSLQTRFGLRGNAKIGSEWSAGYSLVMDLADKGRTSTFSQVQDEGSSKMFNGGNTRAGDDYTVRMRDANWWLESSRLGRVTVGRITSELAVGSPDIAGISHAVSDDVGCNGGALRFRNSATGLTSGTNSISAYSAACGGPWANRVDGLKYQSPTLAGFQFIGTYAGNLKTETGTVDATVGNVANAGTEFGFGLRYAGEFNGVRLAANSGIQWDRFDRDLSIYYQNGDAPNVGDFSAGDTRLFDLGLALMHVPTGLFVNGGYSSLEIKAQTPGTGASNVAPLVADGRTATRWTIHAGVSRNWFGIGNTTFYGEYLDHRNFRYAVNPFAGNFASASGSADALSGDKMRVWGLGANQAIDAAAMDLYVNYRHFSATDPNVTVGLRDISVVTTGARIKF